MQNSGISKFFSSMKIGQKFLIFGILSLISSITLFGMFWGNQNTEINQSLDRIAGIEYATNVSIAMNKIAKHRGITSALLAGDSSFITREKEALGEANAAINVVTNMNSQQGRKLKLVENWNKIVLEWKGLLNDIPRLSPAENFQQHTKMIARISYFMMAIDERSGLTFSNNRADSSTAQLIINQLPANLENLGRIRGKSSALAANGSMVSQADFAMLSETIHSVEKYDEAIHHSLDVIKEFSPESANHISKGADRFFSQTEKFIQLVKAKILSPELITVEASQVFESGTEAIESAQQLEEVLEHELHSILESRISALRFKTYGVLGGMLLLLLIAWVSGFLILRNILQRMNFSESVFKEIEQGNYNNLIAVSGRDEVDSLLTKLSSMQEKLREDRLKEQEKNSEINHIKTALDRTTTNIMMVNPDGIIIYLNDAFQANFRALQHKIQTVIPSFSVDSLIGAQLNSFDIPDFNSHELMRANQTIEKDITIGVSEFRYTMNPIFDIHGEKTGIVMEWVNRTSQVEMENEIKTIVNQAKSGNLEHRMALKGKTGFFKNIGSGINELIEVNASFIGETGRIMSALSRGNLSETMEGEYLGEFDHLKESINKTIFKLRDIISQIKMAAEEVRVDASSIQFGNDRLKERTDQQAASLEKSASSMEEITGTVKNNSVNAHHANELSTLTKKKAEMSRESVPVTIDAMNEICASSKKISEITGVIDEIAFQTNLLALNAAVEAARAGEQGRGFAVVASEVRELAQRSSEAAHKIKDLIIDSNKKVQNGTSLVKDSGEVLKEIVTDVADVSQRISEIAIAGDEQAIGVELINQSISQIDTVTHQNTSLVEETASASEHLNMQAQRLVELVGFFSTDSRIDNQLSQESNNVFNISAA